MINFKFTIFIIFILFSSYGFSEEKTLILGIKAFTENFILAEMAKQLFEDKGFNVVNKTGLGSAVARKALELKQIDLYYEYTGTAYSVFYKGKEFHIMRNKDKLYNWLKKMDKTKGIIWLKPLNINNTYTLMLKKEVSDKLKIVSISDLKSYMDKRKNPINIAIDAEFYGRPDGFQALSNHYNFDKEKYLVRIMEAGLTYLSLVKGLVDVAMGYSTDGRIMHYNLINLVDNKQFFPAYNPAPVIRKEILLKYPEIEKILNKIADVITLEVIRELNYKADVLHKTIKNICREFLITHKLIGY